jgi:ubiquinone/menaquinone biosynthesis C-methylase UbiE
MTSTNDRTATDGLRPAMRRMWASVADRWAEHADDVDTSRAAVTVAMLERAAPRPGDRILELAAGPGGVGLAAADRVGPGGEVVITDVVAEMTAVAAARAAARGLDHVVTCERDLEDLDEPDGAFDVVLCREGLMFATDPGRAATEIRRVLRPGGRVALAVWGPRERNPWLGLLFDALTAQTGRPVPPPGVPGPFSLGDGVRLAALLRDAGLDDVRVEELAVPTRAESFEHWWTRTTALAGPIAGVLAAMPEAARAALRDGLRTEVERYRVPGGYELPGLTLLASARRPATA